MTDAKETDFWAPQNEKIEQEGFIVVVWEPGANAPRFVNEHSFSMATSDKTAQIFWSGVHYSNFGTKHVLDGRENAEDHAKNYTRAHVVQIGRDCPVDFNWSQWERDRAPAKTLSGVRNKFGARNLQVRLRCDDEHDICQHCSTLTHKDESACIGCGAMKPWADNAA